MQRYVIAPVAEIPRGTHKVFTVGGRPIGIFNLDGEFYGLLNRCPHQGGRLCDGLITGLAVGDRAWRIPHDPQRRDGTLPLAWLGVRHPDRPVLVRAG